MITLFPNNQHQVPIHFRIKPRDLMSNSVSLSTETLHALNTAARHFSQLCQSRYEIVLTRGYVNWNAWRRLRGAVGSVIFCLLYWRNKSDAPLLFGSNGHEDGFSIDIALYDVSLQKQIEFLSWRNIMMARTRADDILSDNKSLVDMLNTAMSAAGFVGHPDPREQLQMHYRLSMYGSLPQ